MMPLKNRWLTSCYIEYMGKAILIDCGEGTQIALAEAECKMSRIDLLLITHFHADHISGLAGFLLSLGNCSRTEPLTIYAPTGAKNIIEKLTCICGALPFKLDIHELPTNATTTFTATTIDSMLEVTALPVRHRVQCLGYSFNFKRKPVFNPDKAKALSIPVKLWSTLHKGESITLEDGTTVTTDMVTDGDRKNLKVTYVTDTLPFDDIASLAYQSDLFICEGMYGDESQKASMNDKHHMLMQDACYLAKIADVKTLWLTHYSPAMLNPQDYTKQLLEIFPNTVVSKDGIKTTL
jgi:ribonuclease Z